VEALVQEAFQKRPELEQAVLTLRNDEITLKGARNALMPTLDAYGFYGSSALGGAQSPDAVNFFATCSAPSSTCVCSGSGSSRSCVTIYPPGTFPTVGYGTAVQNLFNSSAPDKGVGFNLTIPIRDRYAQSVQERSLMEYRQAELRLEQLHTQIRMQVVNAMFALSNDRAQVRAALAARDYNQQSLDAERTKLRLGASTSANVLQQERNLATAENNLIAAHAMYAKDRAGLYQTLASTLQHYGINLPEAATGDVRTAPVVPGVEPAKPGNEPTMTPPAAQEQPAPPAQ
jgi:outer membrane protein TolC